MKHTTAFFLHLLMIVLVAFSASGQTYRDSLVYTTVKVSVTHDTTYTVTVPTSHDSSYVRVDTIKIPVPAPVVTLKGMYVHPNQLTIGSATSENNLIAYAKAKGQNMLNLYARSFLYDAGKRAQLAAFTTKCKQNGILIITVDVRFTDSREQAGWISYFQSYAGTLAMIEPLTEYEPWISSGTSTYSAFFYLIRTMGTLTKQYGVKMNFYEGWVGNNYNGLSFSQAPVDSMVKYCDRVFMSNYVKVADYTSTSTSLGKWDNRMDKRCVAIAVAAPKFNKVIQIVEIISLETMAWGAANDFLGTYFACPATSVNKCHSFYGSTYTDGLKAYNDYSTPAVLQYTDVVGRTTFYSKYNFLAQPQ